SRREHHNRYRRLGPNQAAYFRAFDVGQTEVQHNQVGMLGVRDLQRLGAGSHDIYFITSRPEQWRDRALDRHLVVDEQNSCGPRHHTWSAAVAAFLSAGTTMG